MAISKISTKKPLYHKLISIMLQRFLVKGIFLRYRLFYTI